MSTEIITVRDKRTNIYKVFTDVFKALSFCEMTGRRKLILNDHHPLSETNNKKAVNFFVWEFEKNGESMDHYLETQKRFNNSII